MSSFNYNYSSIEKRLANRKKAKLDKVRRRMYAIKDYYKNRPKVI